MYVYSGTCPLNFFCILLHGFDTSSKLNPLSASVALIQKLVNGLMKVTPHKPLVHRGVEYGLRSLSNIALRDTKQLLVSCRKQLGKKDPEFDSKVLHSFKTPKRILKKIIVVLNSTKMFLFEKIDNNFQFNSLFL